MKVSQFTVDKPTTLLQFLAEQLPNTSRTSLKEILAHSVEVDGRRATRHDHPLKPGNVVTITRQNQRERQKPRGMEVVYEDRHLLVVDKSSGLLTNSRDPRDTTVIGELNRSAERRGERWHAHVVHRLDRDTSGLLLVAKSKEVARAFELDWKSTVYDRAYLAVVWGKLDPPQGTYTSWLTDGEFCVLSSPTDNGGKEATTHYRTMNTSRRYSLVEFRLDTGRRNQIRVHCRALGHPVVHDPMYG